MTDPSPVTRLLLKVLDNQVARTDAALEGLPDPLLDHPPGGTANAIREILVHLLELRRFQLRLLDEETAAAAVGVPTDTEVDALDLPDYVARLDAAAGLLRSAIEAHDPDDWNAPPATMREGPWGEEPTVDRLIRPLNDFTNHLGGIRLVRRSLGHPAEHTQ